MDGAIGLDFFILIQNVEIWADAGPDFYIVVGSGPWLAQMGPSWSGKVPWGYVLTIGQRGRSGHGLASTFWGVGVETNRAGRAQ